MNNALATRRTRRSAMAGLQFLLVFAMVAGVFHAPSSMADPADIAGPEEMVWPVDIPEPAEMDVSAACVSTPVANESELNAAISAFNAEERPCCHVITLTTDIFLTAPTRTIVNFRSYHLLGCSLVIDGAGFSVHGAENVRPFSIAAFTRVSMKRITVTGGKLTDLSGGGIYNAGNLYITDITVCDNSVREDEVLVAGGGIYNHSYATLVVANSTVSGNYGVNGNGIGIHNSSHATVTIVNSTVSANTYYDHGSGIVNGRNATMTIANSTVSGNSGKFGGGIENCTGAVLTVANSTIYGNFARIEGGGIINSGAVTLINSTVSGNEAGAQGGGISNRSSATAVLINSTVADNTAGDYQHPVGGIINIGRLVLRNSIIADSGGADCGIWSYYWWPDLHPQVEVFSSLIGDLGENACYVTDRSNGSIIGADPHLGRLADNGGPTWTHALLSQSPAIDKGDDGLAVDPNGNPLQTDQRGKGYARIRGEAVDMGAFEVVFYDLRPKPFN